MKLSDREASTMRAMSSDELLGERLRLKRALFNYRFQRAYGVLEDTSQLKWVRRKMAVVETVLREKRD